MNNKELKAVPLYERLEKIPADIRFGVKDGDDWRAETAWYPIGAMCQQAAAELRRLDTLNAELVSFVSFVLSGLNTGSIKAKPILDFRNEDANEIPIISLASMAQSALAKAEGE